MDIVDFFLGNALNAVDAKGRVSLPSDFRAVVEKRAHAAAAAGVVIADKTIWAGEHENERCLQAFDGSYTTYLQKQLESRAAARGEDMMSAVDEESLAAFGAYLTVSFDAAGRMVMPAHLRKLAGIEDLAFFVGAGRTFQIWNPLRFLEEQADKGRVCRTLRFLLSERGITA